MRKPDPEMLWRRLLAEAESVRGKVVLLCAAGAILLMLYPDEVIRAIIGSAVLVATARSVGPPR